MLHYRNVRNNDEKWAVEYDRKVVNCIWGILYYELGYGGRVTAVTSNRLVVETQCLGARDVVTITGEKKEMDLLIAACGLHAATRSNEGELVEKAQNMLGDLCGKPLYFCHSVGLIRGGVWGGGNLLRCILCQVLGFSEETMKELLKIEKKENFEAAVEMIYEGSKLEDVLMLV